MSWITLSVGASQSGKYRAQPYGAALACRTVPIPSFEPIMVPPGLSNQQIELAILSGVLNKPPPMGFDPGRRMSDEEFDRLVWDHYMRTARSRSWFPESRAPGIVYAAVNARSHYLRVSLTFDASLIRTEILASENLQQADGRIHKKAIKWITRLHEHIRRELGRLAFSARPSASSPR